LTITTCPECNSEILIQSAPSTGGTVRYYCQVCEKPVQLKVEAREVRVDLDSAEERPCILVVDDLATVRTLISDMLEEAGYDVETAADGEQALEGIQRRRPDLVLLDLVLPGKDGFEVLEALSEMDGEAPPVLVMSGTLHQPEEISKASSLGAVGYIPKSALRDTLIFRIRNVLSDPAPAQSA
jgi:CheY-like chemotaxis protein